VDGKKRPIAKRSTEWKPVLESWEEDSAVMLFTAARP
jgi:hypothetical protein